MKCYRFHCSLGSVHECRPYCVVHFGLALDAGATLHNK